MCDSCFNENHNRKAFLGKNRVEKMRIEIIAFGNIRIEIPELHHCKNPILIEYLKLVR